MNKIHPTSISNGNYTIGNNVEIKEFASIAKDSVIKDNASIGEYVRLGERCIIGENVVLKCRATITPDAIVGDNSFIGPHTTFLHGLPGTKNGAPIIENNAYVAANCVIASGVVISEGVVLAAGSVALKSCDKPGLWGGTPAKFIKEYNISEAWKLK
jgi:acetyltransferase-like isoleucine patch superfamily enzyme